jgi:uncharacterized FlaG/YvyC family protein
MINSITNTQAIIIDDMDKIDNRLTKNDNFVKTETKRQAETNSTSLSHDTEKNTERNKPNYDTLKKEIEDMVDTSHNINLEIIEINDKEKMVITVSDKETGETIKQIPSETSLKIMQHLYEKYGVGQITNATI